MLLLSQVSNRWNVAFDLLVIVVVVVHVVVVVVVVVVDPKKPTFKVWLKSGQE